MHICKLLCLLIKVSWAYTKYEGPTGLCWKMYDLDPGNGNENGNGNGNGATDWKWKWEWKWE